MKNTALITPYLYSFIWFPLIFLGTDAIEVKKSITRQSPKLTPILHGYLQGAHAHNIKVT